MKKNAIFDILSGSPLWLDPQSELQFIHTDRLAEIVYGLADLQAWGEIFNVCGKGTVRLDEVAGASGRTFSTHPNSPRVRYEANVEKLQRFVDVPDTRETVFAFVSGSGSPWR
jgi:hypothetical protein